MFEAHVHELEALWNGKTHFSSTTINYTLSGKRIDVQLRGAILPGSETTFDRILITTEDITPYQNALRQEEKNRRLAESMFIYSPLLFGLKTLAVLKIELISLGY